MIIKKAELESTKNTILKQLSQDETDAITLNRTISEFKSSLSSEKTFEGEIFVRIQQKLNTYELAIKSRIDLSKSLSQKISNSITALIAKMGSDNIIDTSMLETLKSTCNKYDSEISRLRQALKATNLEEENKSNILNSIGEYTNIISKAKREIEKIEDIIALDNMCQSQLSSLDSLVSSYKQKVDKIASSQSNIVITTPGTYV